VSKLCPKTDEFGHVKTRVGQKSLLKFCAATKRISVQHLIRKLRKCCLIMLETSYPG